MSNPLLGTTHVHVIDIETAATLLVSINCLEEKISQLQNAWIKGGCMDEPLKQRILCWYKRARLARAILAEYDVDALLKAACSLDYLANSN